MVTPSVPKKTLVAGIVSQAILEKIKRYCPVIASATSKGGVGKSTLSFCEAMVSAIKLQLKTLIIEFDPDRHLSKAILGETTDLPDYASAGDLFREEVIEKPIYQSPEHENLFIIPCRSDFEVTDKSASVFPYFHIQPLREQFDLIIIDCPPGRGIYRDSGMLASTLTVLVAETVAVSLSALNDVITIHEDLVYNLNAATPDFQFDQPEYIIFPNKYHSARQDHKDAKAGLKNLDMAQTDIMPNYSPIEACINRGVLFWELKDGNSRNATKKMFKIVSQILIKAVEGV